MEAETLGNRTTTPAQRDGIGHGLRRLATETKASVKTSEFWMSLAVIVGILVSAAAIKGGDTGGTDEFIARNAWLYVAIVAAAYAISRGLAKSGSVSRTRSPTPTAAVASNGPQRDLGPISRGGVSASAGVSFQDL